MYYMKYEKKGLKTTGEIGLFKNRQGHFKNSDRGHCHFLKSTGDMGTPVKGPCTGVKTQYSMTIMSQLFRLYLTRSENPSVHVDCTLIMTSSRVSARLTHGLLRY